MSDWGLDWLPPLPYVIAGMALAAAFITSGLLRYSERRARRAVKQHGSSGVVIVETYIGEVKPAGPGQSVPTSRPAMAYTLTVSGQGGYGEGVLIESPTLTNPRRGEPT